MVRPRGDRVTSLAKMARQEREMRRTVHGAIGTYLDAVAKAVEPTSVRADATGDGVNLNGLDQSALWPQILTAHVLPTLQTIINEIGPPDSLGLSKTALSAVAAWRSEWLRKRTQVLANVPQTITDTIRAAIAEDAATNGPDPAAAASIVKEHLNPDHLTWKNRATTIARTEVVGGNNQGGLASWNAVHAALAPSGGQVLKTWLATGGPGSREDHNDVDGTEIPIGDTFTVGGEAMTGPGDESASADQIVNCRCTLTYRVDDAEDTDAGADDPSVTAAATEDTVTAPTTDTPPLVDADLPGTVDEDNGTQWTGPLVQLDVATPDGRIFSSTGVTVRDLPLPLSFQRESSHGGEEAGKTVVVGRITSTDIRDGFLWGAGDWLDPVSCYDVVEAAARVSAGLGMVSGDTFPSVISYGAKQPDGTVTAVDPMLFEGDPDALVMVASEWDFMGVTIVADPAFGSTRIEMIPGATVGQVANADDAVAAPSMMADAASPQLPTVTADSVTFPDGTVVKVGDDVNVIDALGSDSPTAGTITAINPTDSTVTLDVAADDGSGDTHSITVDVANIQATTSAADGGSGADAQGSATSGLAAAAAPHRYPAEWFEPVALDGPTALTITDDGRVYGHLATFGQCHVGYQECVTAPSSPSGYAYFHLGEVDTTAGPLAVGKLTVGGGHADAKAGWRGTVEHYDNAGAAVAVVRAHEDEHGIQVTGALVPHATSDQISALKRSPLSGDWRRIGGNLEMVGALSVNVPGFPVPRAALAASGEQLSLVAAGVVHAAAGDGDPEPGGMTLPTGTQLTSVDIALLASAFSRVARDEAKRQGERDTLRARLRAEQRNLLRAKITAR